MRILNLAAFCFALTSALLLYALNYETRRLEDVVQKIERDSQTARSDIALLKAERSHLSRPERIDPLARQLGLLPPKPEQFVMSGALARMSDDMQATAPASSLAASMSQ